MRAIDKDGLRRRGRSSQLPAVGRSALLEAAFAPEKLAEDIDRPRPIIVIPGVVVRHIVLGQLAPGNVEKERENFKRSRR